MVLYKWGSFENENRSRLHRSTLSLQISTLTLQKILLNVESKREEKTWKFRMNYSSISVTINKKSSLCRVKDCATLGIGSMRERFSLKYFTDWFSPRVDWQKSQDQLFQLNRMGCFGFMICRTSSFAKLDHYHRRNSEWLSTLLQLLSSTIRVLFAHSSQWECEAKHCMRSCDDYAWKYCIFIITCQSIL